MSNPLVAERKDSTTAFSGVPLLESVDETKKAIESGDWASGVMGAVGTGLDALGMAMDPFGSILAAGVGWLMEHVGPLSDALDSLTGDPDEIKAHSETWKNISAELGEVAAEMTNLVKSDTERWIGQAGDAYRARSEDTANLITAAQKAAEGASGGIGTAGEVVGAVRSLVRDIIAELVGHLVSWALQVLATLGIGMAWVVPQVVAAVAKVAAQIADITTKLIKAMKALSPLLKKLGDSFGDAGKALKKIKNDNAKADGPPPANSKGPNDSPASTRSQNADGGNGSSSSGSNGPASTSSQNADGKGSGSTSSQNADGNGTRGDGQSGGGGSRSLDGSNKTGSGASTNPAGANGSRGLRDQPPNPRSEKNTRCTKDPIDVSTGQMLLSQIDAEFEAVLPLVFERTHFSSYRTGRWFGPSWMSTLDQRLEVDDAGVSFAAADGTLHHYPHPAPDAWVTSDQGPRRPLGRTEDGGYVLVDPAQQRTLYFGPATSVLPLTSISDLNGNRIDLVHDDSGTPSEIRHSGGYRIRVETENGLVTALRSVASDGTEVELMRYGYQGSRLTEVINHSGRPLRFDYDQAGRITSWTDRNGEWYRYTYDHEGRCVRTEGSGGFLTGTMEYDTENRITHSIDSLGHRTTFHMNEAGQVVKEIDPLGGVIVSEWDATDRLLRRTDQLGRTTRYDYGRGGDPVAITRPDGSRLRQEYDEAGRPVVFVDADGSVSRREYDERGYLARFTDATGATTSYTYDERGNVVGITDALGNTHRVDVDAAGLTVTTTDPTGATTRYERDQFGRVMAATDSLGRVQRFGWTVDGKSAWHQHPDGTTERRAYDGEGNERSRVDELGRTTRTEVTHFDLVSAEIRPDGTRLEFGYDTEMRLTSVTNEIGLTWRYEYDAAGNLVRETDFNGSTTSYRYDAAGQLVETSTGTGEITRFAYDLLGNMIERSNGQTTTTFTYSATGHLLEAVNGESRVSFRRDALGRVTAETINGRTVTSDYDLLGRRIRRRTPSGAESTWEYDANDQLTALHTAGRTLRFEYDQMGREIRRSLGSGLAVDQAWTLADELSSQTIIGAAGQRAQHRAYAYRADGRLVGVRDQLTGTREFVLGADDRITAVQGAGWTERYGYDRAGNLTQAVWPTHPGEERLGEHGYDGTLVSNAGNVRYEHDANGRLVLRQSMSNQANTFRYFWDSDSRLIGVLTPDGSRWRYRYDAIGRRIAKERLGPDGRTVTERVDFTWDGMVLVEQARFGGTVPQARVTVWNHEPGTFRPLTQCERVPRSPQEWVDERFNAIVTDLLGTPVELVDDQGGIAWSNRSSLWGVDPGHGGTPLRFPGQYLDAETGLHYNFFRYYDPALARYLSPDPIGLEAGPNNHAYVTDPHVLSDPLGLAPCDSKWSTTKENQDRVNQLADKHRRQGVGRDRAREAVPKIADHMRKNHPDLVKHLYQGDVKGKSPTGLHAYKDGKLPDNVNVVSQNGKGNSVHEIKYRLDTQPENAAPKRSTMFPKNWSEDQVLAYIGASKPDDFLKDMPAEKWAGASGPKVVDYLKQGHDFHIENPGDGTAFPKKNK